MFRLDLPVILLHFFVGISLPTSQRTFRIVNDPQINILPLWKIDWRPQSITACAVACVGMSPQCYSFLYDVDGHECKPGRGTVATYYSRNISTELLFVVSSCDANRKYLLESNDFGSICFWFSREEEQYNTAVNSCKARGLELVSLKTMVRVSLFMQLSARYLDNGGWIGLDDRKVEGQFRWVDNGSLLQQSSSSDWFKGVEQNDLKSNEDCAAYIGPYILFNDVDCSTKRPYVCQVPMPLDI